MDNTSKVEEAINKYLETEDASFLDSVRGTTGTEPFGDSDLGYAVARGDLSDIIGLIKKITHFSNLLDDPVKQLELDNKVIVDSENKSNDEVEYSFSDIIKQLELDNKYLIDSDSDVDDDDFVVADLETLKKQFSEDDSDDDSDSDEDDDEDFDESDDSEEDDDYEEDSDESDDYDDESYDDSEESEGESEEDLIEDLKDGEGKSLDKILKIFEIAKELESMKSDSYDSEEEDSEDELEEESDEDYDDSNEEDSENELDDDSEEESSDDDNDSNNSDEDENFSYISEFSKNLLNELNFAKNLKVEKDNLKDLSELVEKISSGVRKAKSYNDVEEIEKKGKKAIANYLEDFSIKEKFFAELMKSQAQLDLESSKARLEESKNSDKDKYIQSQLENAKKYDGEMGIGGSSEAKKDIPILEEQKKALASGQDEKYLQEKMRIAEEQVKKEGSNSNTTDELLEKQLLTETVNSSYTRSKKKRKRYY